MDKNQTLDIQAGQLSPVRETDSKGQSWPRLTVPLAEWRRRVGFSMFPGGSPVISGLKHFDL